MKTLKLTTVLVFATMVSMSFASQMVKSKLGDLDILAQRGGDKVISNFSEVDIHGWIDNLTAVGILDDDIEDFEGVTINRDFREYLTYTIDREQTEMRNGDN